MSSHLVVVWDKDAYVPLVFNMRPMQMVSTIDQAVGVAEESGLKLVALYKHPTEKLLNLGIYQPDFKGQIYTILDNLSLSRAVYLFINTLKANEMFDSRVEHFMTNWLYTKVMEGYN